MTLLKKSLIRQGLLQETRAVLELFRELEYLPLAIV
jgi:hypothetical protein